jgi:hypothetical protein
MTQYSTTQSTKNSAESTLGSAFEQRGPSARATLGAGFWSPGRAGYPVTDHPSRVLSTPRSIVTPLCGPAAIIGSRAARHKQAFVLVMWNV